MSKVGKQVGKKKCKIKVINLSIESLWLATRTFSQIGYFILFKTDFLKHDPLGFSKTQVIKTTSFFITFCWNIFAVKGILLNLFTNEQMNNKKGLLWFFMFM